MSTYTDALNQTPPIGASTQLSGGQSSYCLSIQVLCEALPLNNVTDLLDRGQQLAEVRLHVGAARGGGTDLKLAQAALQLGDGLSEGELVPHLLDGVDVAHAVLGQVLAGLQHAAVAARLLGHAGDGGAQQLGSLQDRLTRHGRIGRALAGLSGRGLAEGGAGFCDRGERRKVLIGRGGDSGRWATLGLAGRRKGHQGGGGRTP